MAIAYPGSSDSLTTRVLRSALDKLNYAYDPANDELPAVEWMTNDIGPRPVRRTAQAPVGVPWTNTDPHGRAQVMPDWRYGGDTGDRVAGLPYDTLIEAGLNSHEVSPGPVSAPGIRRVYRPGNTPGITRSRIAPPPDAPILSYSGDTTGQPTVGIPSGPPGIHHGLTPDMYGPAAVDHPGIHPGLTPDMYGPGMDPALPLERPSDVSPGIAVPSSPTVTSRDIPAAAVEAPLVPRGGMGAPGPQRANPPTSRRYSSTRPEFIYTNPAAAGQAASNYQARLGFEAAQDRGYNDYLARMNESDQANERARIQGQTYGNQLALSEREGAANRASAERIALSSETVRQQRLEQAQMDAQDQRAEMGEQSAAMLNADPTSKVNRNYAWINPATGKWESRFRRAVRPAAPPVGVGAALPVPPSVGPNGGRIMPGRSSGGVLAYTAPGS